MLSHYILYPPFYTFSFIMPPFFKHYSKLFSAVIFWVSKWTSLYRVVWTSPWNIWLSREIFFCSSSHSFYPVQSEDHLPLCQWALTLENVKCSGELLKNNEAQTSLPVILIWPIWCQKKPVLINSSRVNLRAVRIANQEFLLLCNRICSITAALECRFNPYPGTVC